MDANCRDHGSAPPRRGLFALVLPDGGVRAAYQVGILRRRASEFSDCSPDVLTGVRAGAIDVAYLAAHPGTFRERMADLADLWASLSVDDVFGVDLGCLARNVVRWAIATRPAACATRGTGFMTTSLHARTAGA
jgi:NTE family protein